MVDTRGLFAQPEVKVGDVIQWTSQGVDQFTTPLRVRAIDSTGEWVFVEAEKDGVPMNQVTVIEKRHEQAPLNNPPVLEFEEKQESLGKLEKEFSRGKLSNQVTYRLIVSGELGPKEIGKLITLLTAQKTILSDEDIQ